MKEKLQNLVAEYGPVIVVVWFAIFFLTWAGFATAIQFFGFQPEGAAESGSLWLVAYGATQLTKPIRFIVTAALAPVGAKLWRKIKASDAEEEQAAIAQDIAAAERVEP